MNSRLIDANKIFPWYLKAFSVDEVGEERAIGPDEPRFSMNDIRENLDNIPTENDWIPCSKRPPEEDGEYFVTLRWSDYPNSVDTLHFTNDLSSVDEVGYAGEKRPGWYEYDSDYGCYEIDNVIAWMPRPEPYKED